MDAAQRMMGVGGPGADPITRSLFYRLLRHTVPTDAVTYDAIRPLPVVRIPA